MVVTSSAAERRSPAGFPTATASAAPIRKSASPIKWWAAAGAAHFALAAYVMVRWLTSGQLHRTHPGPTQVPPHVHIALQVGAWLSPALGLAIVYVFLVRPYLKDRQLTTEGMLLIACLSLYFPYDIVNDYTADLFQYNSYFWNVGSWLGAIPGTLLPNAYKVPEPILFMLPAYAWGVFMPAMIGFWAMRALRQRWPRLSTVTVFVIVLGAMAGIDLILEWGVVWLQIEAYPGAASVGSLAGGTKFQFPAWETLLIGSIYIGGASLLLFRDDKGHTLAERGVDRIATSGVRRTALRLLATIGFMVTVMWLVFNIPIQWFAAHGGPFPTDTPSYFINEVCGPGTAYPTYPCPRAGTPIYKPGSTP